MEALPAKAPKAKGWKPILSVLIFLCCSSSLRSVEPAPEGEKHPLNRKIGFTTEKKTIAGVGKFVWEIQSFDDLSNPAKHVGISYEKKLHLPKLPHTDTVPALVIAKVQLSLKITPPAGAKITRVSIKNAANTKVTANTDYGKPFTTTGLSADATTLSQSGEIADAITVNIQHKKAGVEGSTTASFQIPLVRVDTLSDTLILCTKKIKEEGQHENEYGSELKESGAIERQLYFLPQKGEKVSISCIGHCLHALRHGYQKWDGVDAKVSITKLDDMVEGSAIGFLQTLANKGWTIYYISKDATTRSGRPGRKVIEQLMPCTDVLNCAVQGSPGQNQLNALCALPWAFIVEASGLHVGMSLSGTLYEAHYLKTGDDIYDNRLKAKDFVLSQDFGFIAVPPP